MSAKTTLRISLALSLALVGLAGLWYFYLKPLPETTTPLADFTAPFVFGSFSLPTDNPLTQEAVELGRFLFYDPRLSRNNQVSCATCHQQHLAFSDGKKTSVGVSGKPLLFNSMSLTNLMWGPQRFFWNGRTLSLEEQALMPIEHPDEMGQSLSSVVEELKETEIYPKLFSRAFGEINSNNIARALAAFQRTLISSNSKYDRFLRGQEKLSVLEEQGRRLFVAHPDAKASMRGGNCIDCHSQFLTAGFSEAFDGFTNNGLDHEQQLPLGLMESTGKPQHKGLFKVPTLRNIALTAPYMHDGRFATLEQVLDHYNEGIRSSSTLSPLIVEADNQALTMVDGKVVNENPSLNLSEAEKKALIAFLHSLTDEDFITAPKHSNPFLTR